MRVALLAAAAHGLYTAASIQNDIPCSSLWLAISLGIGLAAIDARRFWPAVVTGLAAHVFPLGRYAVSGTRLSVSTVVSDAIWWIPLSIILAAAYFFRQRNLRDRSPEVLSLALRARTDRGLSIEELSRTGPVLLVFLRHSGCTFCREALADIAAQRRSIEASGATIVLTHMGEPEMGRDFFRKYGLDDLQQVSDPGQGLYRAFGLPRGDLGMVFGPKVWLRGFDAAILRRHGVGRLVGDGFRMPGIFLIFHGQILRSYRHQSVADRPDYTKFVTEDSLSRMVS